MLILPDLCYFWKFQYNLKKLTGIQGINQLGLVCRNCIFTTGRWETTTETITHLQSARDKTKLVETQSTLFWSSNEGDLNALKLIIFGAFKLILLLFIPLFNVILTTTQGFFIDNCKYDHSNLGGYDLKLNLAVTIAKHLFNLSKYETVCYILSIFLANIHLLR